MRAFVSPLVSIDLRGTKSDFFNPSRVCSIRSRRKQELHRDIVFYASNEKKPVLVAGGSGRLGQLIIQKLLQRGKSVRALVRDPSAARTLFDERVDLAEGDTRDRAAVENAVVGVGAIVCATGARPAPNSNGSMEWAAGTPEEVDFKGVRNLAQSFRLKEYRDVDEKTLIDFKYSKPWLSIDDQVMGGQSSSSLEVVSDGIAKFSGNVSLEQNGGFASVVSPLDFYNLSPFDGLSFRVKGDGKRYKFTLRVPQLQRGFVYQAAFDTVADQWAEVRIPFKEFRLCEKNIVVYDETLALNPSSISSFGLMLSRFEFNKFANPNFAPGPFSADFSNISAYKLKSTDSRPPSFVLVSTAAVMRPKRFAMGERSAENLIPIVQLNERLGGILTWKLQGENAVRLSGLPYSIVRPVGLRDEAGGEQGILLVQGDRSSGRITREDVAEVVVRTLGSPASTGKTFEALGKPDGVPPKDEEWEGMFSSLKTDLRSVYDLPSDATVLVS